MDDTGKEIAVAKDLLLTTADGGKAGVGADNISCFFNDKTRSNAALFKIPIRPAAEKFVEKGWDEEKQMYYYLVYFNKEQL